MRGQPQLGLRRFISTTASMSSLSGPCGPGRCRRFGENSKRYFRFLSALWKYSRVAGLRTMAARRSRDGRMKRVHRPAIMRSAGRWLGALAAAIQDQKLMPDQHGFGNHTAQTARL